MQYEERPQGNSRAVFRQAGYIRVLKKKYNQLSLENRHQIEALLDAGHNQTDIAEAIDVHKSTISRELNRNIADSGCGGKNYQPETAQQLTDQRPEVIAERSRLRDIEVDLMVGKNHKSALLVLTDRTTLLTKLKKVPSRKAEPMTARITDQLRDIPPAFIKTLPNITTSALCIEA